MLGMLPVSAVSSAEMLGMLLVSAVSTPASTGPAPSIGSIQS